MRYAIVIDKAGGNLSAYVPDLPGCVATGATLAEIEVEIREAIERLSPLKVHPRDTPPHRARLERAERLYQDLRSVERSILTSLIDQFERALSTQESGHIRTAAAELYSFMSPYFRDDS